ncbi:Abi family protein [Magnetovirga frankeli]|nr:Abi family protein [gamma proteobacterium SS-5]
MEMLKERGMTLDPTTAKFYLSHIGYFRLRGYWIPFEALSTTNGHHVFKAGTCFEQVLNLYTFDRELRLLVMDAIERIEVSVRNQWVDALSANHGAHAYLKSSLFLGSKQFGKSLAEITSGFERSKEAYIKHYKKKYSEPDLPPLWAIVGIMTLGQFSHWFSNLKQKCLRAKISKVYGLDEGVLASFLHHLTVIRNLCAHHGRLWNSELIVTMQLPRSKPKMLASNIEFGPDPNQAPRKLYNTLVMLAYMMDVISPDHHWKHRLKCLITQHDIDTRHMGFPEDFAERSLWADTWKETP